MEIIRAVLCKVLFGYKFIEYRNAPDLNDEFGIDLAVRGERVLVGAPRDDTARPEFGAAYLFDSTTGSLLQTFLNPNPCPYR